MSDVEELQARVEELERTNRQLHELLRTRTAETDDALERLTAILDTISDAIVVSDSRQRIKLLNPAATTLMGLDPLCIGSSLRDHLDLRLAALIEDSSARGQQGQGEVPLSEDRVGVAVVNPIRSDAGDSLGAVTLIRDITREKELDRMKSEFIANVSHELRTPLTSITGFANLVSKRAAALLPKIPDPDAKTKRHIDQVSDNLDIIVRESKRLTGRINEVIDIASLDAGSIQWKPEPCSMNDLVRDAAANSATLFADAELQLVFADEMPTVQVDRQRLVQTIGNLLSNAAKFSGGGSVVCRTRVSATAVAVSVTDTGPGVPDEHLEAIFDRFSQVGSSLTDKPGGTGLGLPFCRGVVEHHGGTIWAESVVGTGTTVTFRLPR